MASLITDINVREAEVTTPYFHKDTSSQVLNGVVISDLKGNLQFVNTAFASMHGYNEKELRGKHLSLFHTEEQMSQEVIPFLEKAKTNGHHQGTVGHLKKDGSTFSTGMSLDLLKNDCGAPTGLIVIVNNGCDDPTLERHQQFRQETSPMGTYTRKIAHDFNNFLNIIIGNIEITKTNVPERSQVQSDLEEALVACTRAQDLVQEIFSSTRRDNNEPKPLQVPLVVKDTLRLLRSSLPVNIKISENVGKGNGLVLADPVQIQRVIMNLYANSCQAMEQTGGRLSVTTAEIDISLADSASLNINPGAYVCLSVSDTGHGIDRTAMNRIFDPYYTTKKKGKGNGLGLYIVREIVNSYGGNIIVSSDPGKGTAVDVYLPRIDKSANAYETNAFDPDPGDNEYHLSMSVD
ncbi:MAG: PAS domain S-box protein [Deltaproteobacteria bacterium]|nr:PAS domain S-box protein [Deltaproteobacteria bacterium]